MGDTSDGDDELFQRLPAMLAKASAPELHSVESSTLLLVLLVLVMLIGGGQGDSELLSSNLESCGQNGGGEGELYCLSKILFQVQLIHGKNTPSDTMETFVTHVQDSRGARKALDVPYRITIYKSDVYAQYPIDYLQSFNANPHEVAISSPHCLDGDKERSPDCGWLYNNDGEKVKDSQGFCCICNTKTNSPFWPRKNNSLRVIEEDCNGTSSRKLNSWRRPGSAHCMRVSKNWYPTYKLGKPILSTSVLVVVQMMHSSDGQPYGLWDMNSQILHLSPRQGLQVHPTRALKAHLQGEFEFDNIHLPLLQDQYLSIPMEEGKSERVAHANQWLILPKDYFTHDGKECDKIGVSYSAFKFQAKACDQPFQSCCGNQLNDFSQEDSQRMLVGEAPKYSFSQYGEAVVQDMSNALEPTTLNLHIDQEKASILTIELGADDLQYYNERSTGKILKANVEQLETGTRRLLLLVQVVNIGIMKTYFKIKVVDCTARVEILPVEINTLLVPAIELSFWIHVLVKEDVGSSNLSTMWCKVILVDTLQEMSSKVEMQFEVPLLEVYPKHLGRPPGLSPTTKHFGIGQWCFFWCNDSQTYIKPPPPPKQVDPCLWNCTEWYNASCFIMNLCWDKLTKFIGILIAIIIGLFVAFLFVQTGALSIILEYLRVVVSKSTKTAGKIGKNVKRAQKKRLKKRTRAAIKAQKDEAKKDFVDERVEDDEEEAYEKIVLRVGKKKKKKRKHRNKDGDTEGGKKGGKKGKKKGKKGKKKKKEKNDKSSEEEEHSEGNDHEDEDDHENEDGEDEDDHDDS